MTRELSPKVGAAMLRNAFTSKGAAISHTEALDLLAKLKGYEAWSHMQQADTKPVSAPKKKKERKAKTEITLTDLLIQQYGRGGELPSKTSLSRADWLASESSLEYWAWVVGSIDANELWWGASTYAPRAPVEVTLPDGSVSKWDIEPNLSSRWGELNDFSHTTKPGLFLLTIDGELHEKLQNQMWDEATFIVRKDGQLGLLFEAEYASIESESPHDEDAFQRYKPHKQVVAYLLEELKTLQVLYPQVEFCVPDSSEIVNDRPGVWGFYKLDTLDATQRQELGMKLLSL